MNNKEIATTILNQLGGPQFIAMTGARDLLSVDNGLQMTLPRNASGANRLTITLTAMDDYVVRFWKYTPYRCSFKNGVFKEYKEKYTDVKTYDGIYCNMLQDVFTRTTGMYTRLF